MQTLTHCRNGHERTEENTLIRSNGKTECRICKRSQGRRFYSANTEKLRNKTKKYYQENLEKCLEARRRYSELHKQQGIEYAKKYRKTIVGRFSILKASAATRGIEMLLSIQEYESLVVTKRCQYCVGLLPEAGGGIDRINNHKGYTIDNCVPCCVRCNKIKGCLEMAGFTGERAIELLREALNKHEEILTLSR